MGFFHNLMNKLGRYRLIPDRQTGEDYMHRYYLFLKDRKKFPFNVTLHKIVKSDDPIYHDHPWPFMTVVLKGGYWEHTPIFNSKNQFIGDVRTWRGPGSIIMRKATEFHWLEMHPDKNSATTLFFMGPQQRDWGFLITKFKSNKHWVQWENYLKNYKQYHKTYVEPQIYAMSKKKD